MRGRRGRLLAGAVLVALLALPRPAAAHALLASSDPVNGARLDEAPRELILRFTEPPELSLSEVGLLDQAGSELETANPRVLPEEPAAISVALPELDRGVYTVTWRTVSRVDGHPSGGTFAFGVGVSPPETTVPSHVAEAHETPDPSPLEMAGRLILFVGLGLLVGASWVGGIAFAQIPGGVRRLAGGAWLVSVAGLIVLAIAQQRASGVGFGDFLPTAVGRALVFRAVALAVAGAGLLAAIVPRARRPGLLLAGLAAGAAVLAHVAAGHAAARGDLAWAKVLAQWVHVIAVGVWLGGLAALLLGVRGGESNAKAAAVRRFSAVAAFALAGVVLTGVVRAVNEVGGWSELFTTGYGQVVLIKAGLLAGLAGLGAINRYRNVPRVATSLRGLRRVSRGELVLAAGALSAAAVLATLVPPAQVPAIAHPPPALAASGSDFATSVRARLSVDPGLPGPNRFMVEVNDYDSGEPVTAERVALRFSYLGGATIEDSTLELRRAGPGEYHATGSNLSIGGPYEVAVLVQRGDDSVEVPLQVATLCEATEIPGQGNEPDIYIVEVPEVGSVEGFLIPLGGDQYEVHFTFLHHGGMELHVEGEPSMVATREGSDAQTLQPEPLSKGHYLAVAHLEPGHWRFHGAASGGGISLAGCFEQMLGG